MEERYKTGAGGHPEAYDALGRYTSEDIEKFLKVANQSRPSPPAKLHKITPEANNKFSKILDHLPGITQAEKGVYKSLFDWEGGDKVNPQNGSVGGILKRTLENLKERFKPSEESVKRGKLTLDDISKVYRAYFDDSLKNVGGHKALDELFKQSKESQFVTNAVADTIFQNGPAGGPTAIRLAILDKDADLDHQKYMDKKAWEKLLYLARDPVDHATLLNRISDGRKEVQYRNVNKGKGNIEEGLLERYRYFRGY